MLNDHLTPVRAGFIPLVDSAILAIAREKGFAKAHSIDLQLFKEPSWANIRDRINIGEFDIAHMLAGMPIASNLGIGQVKSDIIAPMALSSGGNAITVGLELHGQLQSIEQNLSDPMASALALKTVIEERQTIALGPLTFGMVFPFSCHNYQLRYWMAAAGIDPGRDVRLVVIPPPYMVTSLKSHQIDGFCVGQPWYALAAQQGVAKIILSGSHVWPSGPEKVLGLRQSWAEKNPSLLSALLRALVQAAQWCDNTENHQELAHILSSPDYLNVEPETIRAALLGDLTFFADGRVQALPEHALWLYGQMCRWGQATFGKEFKETVQETYRSDLLRTALDDLPDGSYQVKSFPAFTADDMETYISTCPNMSNF